MVDAPTINWVGQSGTKYKYWIYEIGTTFKPSPANYVFAKRTKEDTYRPIYIGQTEDISERFDNHHKMPCIKRNGATHVCTHDKGQNEANRLTEESDLIENYKPICNGWDSGSLSTSRLLVSSATSLS